VTTVSSPPVPIQVKPRASERAAEFAREQRPSVIVGGLVAAFLVAVAVRLPWADDLMLHLAVLQHLMRNPLHPGNPVLDLGGSSIYYSPYMVALALPGKLLGLSAYSVYKLSAVVNVGLLLTGLYRFVRTLSDARWAPPLALLGLLFWWGTTAFAWSGFLSLISLGDTEAYPSTLATAMTLHLWAWLYDGGRTLRSPKRSLGVGALLGLILLIHQFTGLSAVIGCGAILLAQYRLVLSKPVLRNLALGLAACAVVIAIWPYYHLWSVSGGQVDVLDPVHKPLYTHMNVWYGMGFVLGAVALVLRWWRDKMDVLALMFLGLFAVVAFGLVSQHWSFGRSWPMLMLILQVAAAVAAAEAKPGRMRWTWTVPVAVITGFGVWTQFGALLFLVPYSAQQSVSKALGTHGWIQSIPHLDELDSYFKPNEVMAAPSILGQFEISAHGSYDVTTPWFLPGVPEATQRQLYHVDEALFADTTTVAQRATLLTQYKVSAVLLIPGDTLPSGFPAVLVAQQAGYRLYRVTA
jgi:hypothetical protein